MTKTFSTINVRVYYNEPTIIVSDKEVCIYEYGFFHVNVEVKNFLFVID